MTFIPRLEKLKAGLGAAGVAAVGLEAVAKGLPTTVMSGIVGDIAQLIVVIVVGIFAGRVTRPSQKEVELEMAAKRESAIGDASNR